MHITCATYKYGKVAEEKDVVSSRNSFIPSLIVHVLKGCYFNANLFYVAQFLNTENWDTQIWK